MAKNIKKRKILVVGAKGMLGSDLMRVFSPDFFVTGVDIEDIDIVNWDDVYSCLQKNRPDVVINAAAFTDVEGAEDKKEYAYNINVLGVENLATASTLLGIRLVHISTDYIFDGKKKTPYKEEDGPDPINAYGETKWLGDKALLEIFWGCENNDYLIVRTSWLFGRKGADFISKIVQKIENGESEIRVVNDQQGSPTYSPDLAKTIAALVNNDITGILNVSNSGAATWFDITKKIKEYSFPKKEVRIIPINTSEITLKAKRPPYSVLDSERLEFILGEKLRPWQDALEEYLGTFKA